MAHFAEIDEDNVVLGVIVVDNKFLLDENGLEQESLGVEHLKSVLGQEKRFVQTSYNTFDGVHNDGGTPIRKNYAGPGMVYNEDIDGFVQPKPFPSWALNEFKGVYLPPVPYPNTPEHWAWNENTLSWELYPSISEQTVPSDSQ
jgi:hypothetical protein